MIRQVCVLLAFLTIAKCTAVNQLTNIDSLVPKNPAPVHETTDTSKPFNERYSQITTNGASLTQSYPVYSIPTHTPLYPSQYLLSPAVTSQYPGQYHDGIPIVKTYSTSEAIELADSHVSDNSLKITYSEAPLVSHMTFTGLGTNYAW